MVENFHISSENCTCTVRISGCINSNNANAFADALNKVPPYEHLVLDLEHLEYISSAGLRVILRMRKDHTDMEVNNLSTEVYEVFDMTGFTQMMKVTRAYRRISVDGCEMIGRGGNGEVYRIDPDTVVKVYMNEDALPDIEHERDVARKALILGIPTAISYDVVRVGDRYASMFEMLNAKSFSDLLATDSEHMELYARQYIDLLKLIHSTEVPEGQLPDQRQVAIGWIEDIRGYLPIEVYDKIRSLIGNIPMDHHMIHGDYHTNNLMLTNDEVLLIDMETLAVGHPVFEMASMYNAYIGFRLLDHESVHAFLGFNYDTSVRFWKRSLALYYGTEDDQILQQYENKAKVIGLTRIMRRNIRRGEDPALVDRCREELIELSEVVDSLI